jgi:parallel beta-helix repeat protein
MKTKNIGKGFGYELFVRGLIICFVIFGSLSAVDAATYQCDSCVSCTRCLTGRDCDPVAPGVQTIAPGDTLNLVANIGPGAAPPTHLNAFGNCINWNASGSGVTFVCNANRIIGTGAGDGVHVTGGCPGAQIQNCTIRNFEHGIFLKDTNLFTIWKNNDIHHNRLHGILLVNSDNNSIERNQIHDNSVDGIRLENSNKNDMMMNTLQRNGDDGINLWSSRTNIITDNTINNNGADGIKLKESNDNRIERNDVLGNGRHGMYLITSNSNQQ